MALVLKRLYHGYTWLFHDIADRRTDDFKLVSSPFVPMAIILSYLLIVYKLGPKLMENRPPFNLKNIIRVYNVVQIVLNIYVTIIGCVMLKDIDWTCGEIDYSISAKENTAFFVGYLYYFLKILDLTDTVFYLLKKSYRQVTFLHVYHHAMMVLCIWIAIRYIAGGAGYWVSTVNSFIHSVMYTYYLLVTFDDKWRATKYKRMLTGLQMVQFTTFVFIYTRILLNADCHYPKFVCYVFVIQNVYMLMLFGDFYIKTYINKRKK